jgi:hypothetical protein
VAPFGECNRNECKVANFWSVATCACTGNSILCPNGSHLVISVSARGRGPPRYGNPGVLSSRARVVARFLADLKRRSAIGRGLKLPQRPPTAVAAIIPYRPARFHRSPREFALLVGEFSATACAESAKGTVAGRNERTTDRVAVGECTRCRDFSVQVTTTLERTRFACIYAVARRHVSPSGGVGRQFVRRFHHVFARRLADDIRVVRAGRPSVRRSIVAVDRLPRRSASLRAARYRRSCRRPCDRPTTDFVESVRGISMEFAWCLSLPLGIWQRNFRIRRVARRSSIGVSAVKIPR